MGTERRSWKSCCVAVFLGGSFVTALLVALVKKSGDLPEWTPEQRAAIDQASAAMRTIPRFDREEEPKPETAATPRPALKWYEGGTLHDATASRRVMQQRIR